MKYVHLEKNTNKILGWYDKSIHSEIPKPNIEVDSKVWQEALNINANCYEDGKFIVKDFRTDEEVAKEELSKKLQDAKEYLTNTDHKFLNGYIPKDGEDLNAIETTRNSYREFIRLNEGETDGI